MEYLISASTDIGNVKNTNQDSYLIRSLSTKDGKMVFAVLCDGMGGLAKGEVASSSLVNAMADWTESRLPLLLEKGILDSDIRTEWTEIVRSYNEKIRAYGEAQNIRLGTTITALLLTDDRYYIINVGDTRCYELYDGVSQITRDQTVVQREVDRGNMTPEQAENDPRRSVLLQCIGASDNVYPDFFFGDSKKDTVYMLCSDGFRHLITENEIYQYLGPQTALSQNQMKEYSEYLIRLNKERSERDNITVLTIRTY